MQFRERDIGFHPYKTEIDGDIVTVAEMGKERDKDWDKSVKRSRKKNGEYLASISQYL